MWTSCNRNACGSPLTEATPRQTKVVRFEDEMRLDGLLVRLRRSPLNVHIASGRPHHGVRYTRCRTYLGTEKRESGPKFAAFVNLCGSSSMISDDSQRNACHFAAAVGVGCRYAMGPEKNDTLLFPDFRTLIRGSCERHEQHQSR